MRHTQQQAQAVTHTVETALHESFAELVQEMSRLVNKRLAHMQTVLREFSAKEQP